MLTTGEKYFNFVAFAHLVNSGFPTKFKMIRFILVNTDKVIPILPG